MRRAVIVSGAAILVGACSLFTDLGGFDEPGADGGAVVDAPTTVALDAAPPPDSGADAFVRPDAALDACPTADPADGLLAFYPLDEGQGTTVTDCSPTKLHGALIGTPTALKWVPGHNAASGMAVDFDGTGACFDMGDAPALEFANKTFTIAAWVKIRVFETGQSTARYVFARENESGSLRGWHFGSDDPFSMELDVVTADGGQREIAEPIAADTWTHVAIIYEGGGSGSVRLYVNGLLEDTAGPHVLAPAPAGVARFGCKTPTEKVLNGAVDDLRIYGRALTEAEITRVATP